MSLSGGLACPRSSEYLPSTLHDNFKFFEKYPHYIFRFSGALYAPETLDFHSVIFNTEAHPFRR